ncbi:MAG: CopG family transcriptional regulator [Candidatus Bathyarchaeales archaeon]
MVKRIMVTLDDEQYEIIKKLKGFGTKDAEKIRNIIIAFLSEKSYLKAFQK